MGDGTATIERLDRGADWFNDQFLEIGKKPRWFRRAFLLLLPVSGPIWFGLLVLWVVCLLMPAFVMEAFVRPAIRVWSRP